MKHWKVAAGVAVTALLTAVMITSVTRALAGDEPDLGPAVQVTQAPTDTSTPPTTAAPPTTRPAPTTTTAPPQRPARGGGEPVSPAPPLRGGCDDGEFDDRCADDNRDDNCGSGSDDGNDDDGGDDDGSDG